MSTANRAGVGAKRDAGWLAVMVYVLARIVGHLEPTLMLSFSGTGDAARRVLLERAMSTFSRRVASPERINIYSHNGGHADLDATEPSIEEAMRKAVADAAARAQARVEAMLAGR